MRAIDAIRITLKFSDMGMKYLGERKYGDGSSLHAFILETMARFPRVAPPGLAYHVLNRAVARTRLFRTDRDYEAFQRVLVEAHARFA